MVPLTTRNWVTVFFHVLTLSISASKQPRRGIGFLLGEGIQLCVSRLQWYFLLECVLGFSGIFSHPGCWLMSPSLLPFGPLLHWLEHGQWVHFLSGDYWVVTETQSQSLMSCLALAGLILPLTWFSLVCRCLSVSLCTFWQNDLSWSKRCMFFRRLGTWIVVPNGWVHSIGTCSHCLPSVWGELSFCVVLSNSGVCTLFTGTVSEMSTFSMSCAGLSMSSLFAACSNSCWKVYLLTMASLHSFLSLVVFKILLCIASSGSAKLHLAT